MLSAILIYLTSSWRRPAETIISADNIMLLIIAQAGNWKQCSRRNVRVRMLGVRFVFSDSRRRKHLKEA